MNAGSDGADADEQDDAARGLSPTAARRRLGALLRDLRDRAGLTLDQTGQAMQRSPATMSRLETGKVKPRRLDVVHLLDLYAQQAARAVSEADRERALVLTEESRQEAWFSRYRDVLAGSMVNDHARRYMEFETDAARIESFQPDLLPGLLQTRGYIDAIARNYYPDSTAEQRERFVEFRLRRQQVLRRREDPLHLHVVLGEAALRRAPDGPTTMREQLGLLADHVRKGTPNIVVQIAPAALAIRAVFGGPFVVMSFTDAEDDDFVFLEGRSGAEYLHSAAYLEQYRQYFDDLTGSALDRDGSLAMIEEAMTALDR